VRTHRLLALANFSEKSGKLAQLMGYRFTTVAVMGAIEIETLKQDVQEGRIAADRLVDLLASQQRVMEELRRQLRAANQCIEELEKKLGSPPTAKLDEPFSLRAEEKRQDARGKKTKPKSKKRRGRCRTKDKVAQAERSERVYP
jgi:transposase